VTGQNTARYSAERAQSGNQPIVVLTDRHDGRCLRIALHGAALLGFELPFGGRVHDLADGYRDGAEIAARPGSRFAIMAPFAGRVADAHYRFDGQLEDLQPGASGGGNWSGAAVDPETGMLNIRSELNLAIWRAFQEAGIEIPYPQRVVHLKQQAEGA